jgi:hypothetical protein
LDFNVSKEIVTQQIIGDIVNKSKAFKVKQLLVKGKIKIIQFKHDVFDILALSKNRIVCSSLDNKCLALYDDNLNLLK